MPTNPTWDETEDISAAPTWDNTIAEGEPERTNRFGETRSDLERQMREARAEGIGDKAILGLADLGERAAYTASLMDPLTAVGRVINPNQQSAIPVEAAKRAIEFFDPFGNAPVGSARAGAQEFGAELVSGLALPEAVAAMATGKINPQLPGRLFQPGLIKGSQQAAANLAQAETPAEAAKAALELGLTVGGTAGIEAHGAQAAKLKPTDLVEPKAEVVEPVPEPKPVEPPAPVKVNLPEEIKVETKPEVAAEPTLPETKPEPTPAPAPVAEPTPTAEPAKAQVQPPAVTEAKPSGVGEEIMRPGPGASVATDIGAESAAFGAARRAAELADEATKVKDIEISKDPVTEADLRDSDPNVEARWQAAKIKQKSISQKASEAITRAKNLFTRHYPELDPKTDGVQQDILRRHENDPAYSKYLAAQALKGITSELGPRSFGVFNRVIVLRDLLKYSQDKLKSSEQLPFGYSSIPAMEASLAKFEKLADKFPQIRKAIQKRDEFMDALRYDLVSRGLLNEKAKDYNAYFHHQVLHYLEMKDSPKATAGAPGLRQKTQSWQKKRTGSIRDYNTDYLEAEFEVISQSLYQIASQEAKNSIQKASDILPELKAAAKQARDEGREVTWEQLIPDDYQIYQLEPGNHFFKANSISEKVLDEYFNGLKEIDREDVRKVIAMGGPKEQWVIPKRLAKTLNEFGAKHEMELGKYVRKMQNGWKRYTLFNPIRLAIYELNNFSGDADITMAADPGIFKHVNVAEKSLRDFVLKKKTGTQEINELIQNGVIDSGFSMQELPELKGDQYFRHLTDARKGVWEKTVGKYWDSVLDFNRYREGILRYAAYLRALEKIRAGEKPYWASKKAEMDAMYEGMGKTVTAENVAAKLSRELVGDYGNISAAGQWIREKMIPFYSWMEINAPRYVRLFQNAPLESKTGGRVVGTKAAFATGKVAAQAAALYLLGNLWNKTMFPKEEEELSRQGNQFHIILGRNEDGSIRSLRLQGALSDALSWFGAENLIRDVEDVAGGTATLGDKAKQALKATPNKLANAAWPLFKTPAEAVFQRSTYPDLFNPRTVRDPGQHMAKLFSAGTVYNYLTNKPQRPGTWNPLSLATYTTDPGEAAYYAAKSLVSDYLKDNQKEIPASIPTRRSNALYYYKQAIKYKDPKLQKYWLKEYMDLGGKTEGLKTSIANSDPLHGLGKTKNKFLTSLTPAEKQIVNEANKWYLKTYATKTRVK